MDANLHHAAFARRSHLLGNKLLAFWAPLFLLDLLHFVARVDVLAFRCIDASRLFAFSDRHFLFAFAWLAFGLGVHLRARHTDLMRTSAEI